MTVLIIYAHPSGQSFGQLVLECVIGTLNELGRQYTLEDLYKQEFNPVLSEDEYNTYWDNKPPSDHELNLLSCSRIIFIYPTWNHGFPAILKGYIDKTFRPTIAFSRNVEGKICFHELSNIKSAIFVTTYGSSLLQNYLLNFNAQKVTTTRGFGRLFSRDCVVVWKALYAMDSSSEKKRSKFLRELRQIIYKTVL